MEKNSKCSLIKKLVMMGMFGTALAATSYVAALSSHEAEMLMFKLSGSKIEKAIGKGGPTRSESGGKKYS